jgi:hypothetical protein
MSFVPMVWSFAGLPGVRLLNEKEVSLGDGFSLMRRSDSLLNARTQSLMSEEEFKEEGRCAWFLVFRKQKHEDQIAPDCSELQNGLTSFQILKPSRTSGWMYLCEQWKDHTSLSLQTTERRPPMEPRYWARIRAFDDDFLPQVPAIISKVIQTMAGPSTERKNAIILLQLALEHMHPLIAGLLHVIGMEAIFDSGGRFDFKSKLCKCLGGSTRVFPDWNSPTMSQPSHTVDELAIPIYMLRSKLAHGADLRKAAMDKSTPVDLVRKVALSSELEPQAHAFLLAEAACYLHCQVLQRVL